jgi:hypothetical protein
MRILPFLLLPMLAVAGCSAESNAPPVSTSRNSSGAASQEPEAANSLPRGAAVDAPLTSRVGNLGTTQVGPSAPSRY